MRERKIRLALIALLALVGFFTGLNYFSQNPLEEIKGCFEFGFAALMCAEEFSKSVKALVLDAVKNFLLLFSGAFLFIFIPLTLFSLFSLNFKMGVFLACVAKTLAFKGVVEIIFVVLLCAFVFASSVSLAFFVIEKNLQFRQKRRFDYLDGIFIFKSIGFLTAFILIILLFLLGCRFTNNSIFGFFNTYL